ncbi:MAG: response regulator [Clostridia bacterium]|nr:response regulator [Clostridia bacterium]
MPDWVVYGMIYAGSALMIYNIFHYVRFARKLQEKKKWGNERRVLYIPIFLLVMFLFGYLFVGFFGNPDFIVSGILFGGSVFVFIIFHILQSITSHVQENERLEAELKAAEESNKVKTTFLSNMSHEMRTPLNAIMGLDALALQNPALPPETRAQLEKVGVNAKHLLRMINDVLDMNSIESGSMVLKEEEFSLRETLELASSVTRNRCEEKGLVYESRFSDGLDDYYMGDETMLKHALLNVLSNAVKFTPAPGTVTFTVEQDASADPCRTLRFIISDTGIGIDKKLLPNLFTPFTTGDASSTNRFGGSGLGLALSKRVTEMMGGGIAVSSKKGEGSTFTLTVRLTASARKKEPAQAPDAAGGETRLEGLKVLIVEDIDLNAEIVADLLDLEGISSDRAENGLVAVDMFSRSKPYTYDAILMDLRMPVMDGLDATRTIRALDRPDAKTVPILALTANAFDEDVRNSLEAGMNAHMAKPVDPDVLFDNLRHLVPEHKGTHR